MCRCEIDILRKFTTVHKVKGYRVWDTMKSEFEEIVELAGELLEADPHTMDILRSTTEYLLSCDITQKADSSTSSKSLAPKPLARPLFSSTFGPVTALWAPATRCQSPKIRLKAIALLIAYPRTEGFVDSRLTGRIAWKSMMLEENARTHDNGSDGTIPFSARVEEISIN
jgi:hypothetical protein